MKVTGAFSSAFDRSWSEFLSARKKVRFKASGKSVHDLRVSTRRINASLELMHSLSRSGDITDLQRDFKKILKCMGPIRDLQVQIELLSELRPAGPIADFKRSLERREKREIAGVRKDLKRRTKRRLVKQVEAVRSELVRLHERLGPEKIRNSVDRVLRVRRNTFVRTRKNFKPSEGETMHRMRIALKKLRYAFEAAQPVLGNSASERARDLHVLQQIMGDARDVELLKERLEKWASKRGNKIAIAPILDTLQEKWDGLMVKIKDATAAFEDVVPAAETPRPAVEKTLAASASGNGVPVPGRIRAGS